MEERSPKYPRTLCTVSHFIWKTKKNDKSILITVLYNTVTEREDNVARQEQPQDLFIRGSEARRNYLQQS